MQGYPWRIRGGGLWRQHAGDLFISLFHTQTVQRGHGGEIVFLQNAVRFMATLAGGDVGMRHAEIANMPMALFIQALHQDHDRPFVIVTDRGKPACVARQQHQ